MTKDKICGICKTVIDMNKPFCKLIQYELAGKITSKTYYHIQCFRDRLSGSKTLENLQIQTAKLLNKANELIS